MKKCDVKVHIKMNKLKLERLNLISGVIKSIFLNKKKNFY